MDFFDRHAGLRRAVALLLAAASAAGWTAGFLPRPSLARRRAAPARAARASAPDVVLCDIGLPGMTGYDLALELRKAFDRAVRLVAVSGYAQPEDVRKAVEAGFDEHVAKPPDPARIARLLG